MNPRDEQMADLLEQYLNALDSNPHAEQPPDLDPQLLEVAHKMDTHFNARAPSPEFVASLREQLGREAAIIHDSKRKRGRGFFALSRWSYVGIGAAVVLALGALILYATRPTPASADMVLTRASSVANNLAASGVRTFQLESESEQIIVGDAQQPIAGISNNTTKMAYLSPTRWRVQGTTTANGETLETLAVSDGATLWTYDAYDKIALADVATGEGLPLPNVGSLDLLREDWSNCYSPQIVGEEEVAGRPAYRVDLGENKCRSASLFMFDGTRTLWIDKETFFVLRDIFLGKDGKQNLGTYTVRNIEYNVELPDSLFEYTPPPGARVTDNRPKPAPGAAEFQAQLAALARSADYPVFAPATLSDGLVPRVPQLDALENDIKLEYVPPDEASTNTMADSHGVIIRERLGDYDTLRNWTDGSERIDVDGNIGWVRRGDFDPNLNTGANSAVVLVRDGTLISISSFGVSPESLIEIAKKLEPVPGGHAPMPNPTPPTLADVRARSDFPFFVPIYVPEGLMPAPPVGNQVQYHRADGSVALIIQNAKEGQGGMEQDPRFAGESITLPNGLAAHVSAFEPEITILWWHQENGYISLEGHGIPRDEMLRIAASMSSTADLGVTELPPARPTPTPVPSPSFTILRPAFLPEEMTGTETNVPSTSQNGSGIELHFDPHPGDSPHDTLTLTEFPAGSDNLIIDDPQAVKLDIGGREVTVVKRGKGCVTYSWIQDGLSLVLTNPYDPPGEPGQVRYTCDQMEKIVSSIR